MREHINLNQEDVNQDIPVNEKITKNSIRSRIPIRVQLNHKIIAATPKVNCYSNVKSEPEKPYRRDRNRLLSNHGKRYGIFASESQVMKNRKHNCYEKSKLFERQQLYYEKVTSEMKVLLEKWEYYASGDNGNSSSETNELPEHHKFTVSNNEILTLLKGLGEKAIQFHYHRTTNTLNEKASEDFFDNILNLKNKIFEAIKEGMMRFLEYEKEIDHLKATNEDLTGKLRSADQKLINQAIENKSIQESREGSFKKIEEKLRDIIEKLQCQFRAQKLLQAKTERELAVLRSDYFAVERTNSKLNAELATCSEKLDECHKLNGIMEEKANLRLKEQEEIVRKYEEQLVASHTTIDRMENELIDARNKNHEYDAAQTKGKPLR